MNGNLFPLGDPDTVFDLTRDLPDEHFFASGVALVDTIDFSQMVGDTGELYLRCDAGNPGAIHRQIEFIAYDFSIYGADETCFDNLSFRQGQCMLTYPNNGVTVRNCEIAYMGGAVIGFDRDGIPLLGGDGITLGGSHNLAEHNYMHHIYDNGGTIEMCEDGLEYSDITFADNLIENCNGGILMAKWFGATDMALRDIMLRDNLILSCGDVWSRSLHVASSTPALSTGIGISDCKMVYFENLCIEGNTLCQTLGNMLSFPLVSGELPSFKDNLLYFGNGAGLAALVYDRDSNRMSFIGRDELDKLNILLPDGGQSWVAQDTNLLSVPPIVAFSPIALSELPTVEPEGEPQFDLSNNEELANAFTSGFAPDVWRDQLDTNICINDFCAFMMRVIQSRDASLIPQWETLSENALSTTRRMKREDAMIVVYEAACLMGQGRDTTGDWQATDSLLKKGDHYMELSNEYPEWDNLEEKAPFCTDCDKMIAAAYHFAQGQVSLVSGNRVFDLDEENKDLHMLDPLKKGEAILILQRFEESLQEQATNSLALPINTATPESADNTPDVADDSELSRAKAYGLPYETVISADAPLTW